MAKKNAIQKYVDIYYERIGNIQSSKITGRMNEDYWKQLITNIFSAGQISQSEMNTLYENEGIGFYGAGNDYVREIQDPNLVNLQHILDPGTRGIEGGTKSRSSNLISGIKVKYTRGSGGLIMEPYSTAMMKPYPPELPVGSLIRYLKTGWRAINSKRTMVPRDVGKYFAENVTNDELYKTSLRYQVEAIFEVSSSTRTARGIVTVVQG